MPVMSCATVSSPSSKRLRRSRGRPGRGTHQNRECDQRQHVAQEIALIADERAEQVARHEHVTMAMGVMSGRDAPLLDMLRRLLLYSLGAGRWCLVQTCAGLEHIHHHEAKVAGDGHVREEQARRCVRRAAPAPESPSWTTP
jgi:hypothetical protein